MTTDINRTIAASFNRGWYGSRELTNAERYEPSASSAIGKQIIDERYLEDTLAIERKYFPPTNNVKPLIWKNFVPQLAFSGINAGRAPRDQPDLVEPHHSFSIITSFYAHIHFFSQCAASVSALIDKDYSDTGERRINWVIGIDDPLFSESDLTPLIPSHILPYVTIFSDGKNKGVSERLNELIKISTGNWIVLLDCDDLIDDRATNILEHYIHQFPECRYVSSSMIDIDDSGSVMRWRQNESAPTSLFERGMIAGHLKVIRRDLFRDVGDYKLEFSGCQDYDFALRVAAREPILLIPDYLYSYRWHTRSVSVGAVRRQANIADAVRKSFLLEFYADSAPDSALPPAKPAKLKKGFCIVRTQGRRLELLAETLASIRSQSVPVTPCIVVHGKKDAFENVKLWVDSIQNDAIVLLASRIDRRRGHPMNIALDYLRLNSDEFDFFFFLDDDDILYPLYTQRLSAALELSGADVVFGLANQRVPWLAPEQVHRALPVPCLVAGNFIPIHCYITRTEVIVKSGARVREDMDYLEDWDFLLTLLGSNAKFQYLPEVVCEYRIIGDGNQLVRRDPAHYAECAERVKARGRSTARKLGRARFFTELIEFNFSDRDELAPPEIGHIKDSLWVFDSVANDSHE